MYLSIYSVIEFTKSKFFKDYAVMLVINMPSLSF